MRLASILATALDRNYLQTRVINPLTGDFVAIDARPGKSNIVVRKNEKVIIEQGTPEEVAMLLAGTYQEFLHRTEECLFAVRSGAVWSFFDREGSEIDIVFDRQKEDWFMINDGEITNRSKDVNIMSGFIYERLPVPPIERLRTLNDERILDAATAAERWGIDPSRIRQAVDRFPVGTIRKFGKQWVVTIEGMYHVFGPPRKTR